MYLVQGIGEWDFEIGVEVVRNAQMTDIINAVYRELGDKIVNVRALPQIRYMKSALCIM